MHSRWKKCGGQVNPVDEDSRARRVCPRLILLGFLGRRVISDPEKEGSSSSCEASGSSSSRQSVSPFILGGNSFFTWTSCSRSLFRFTRLATRMNEVRAKMMQKASAKFEGECCIALRSTIIEGTRRHEDIDRRRTECKNFNESVSKLVSRKRIQHSNERSFRGSNFHPVVFTSRKNNCEGASEIIESRILVD